MCVWTCVYIPVCVYLPVCVWYEQGEEQEVGGSLVLTGMEEQFQHWGIFDQSHTQLVQQEDQLRLHHTTAVWRGAQVITCSNCLNILPATLAACETTS